MQNKKSQEGLSIKKEDNFSEWYNQILDKAEITDMRYGVKGFVVIRPWGAMTIEKMYKLYEEALQKKGHKPVFFPTVKPVFETKFVLDFLSSLLGGVWGFSYRRSFFLSFSISIFESINFSSNSSLDFSWY